MDINRKIEEIRQKPEHIRMRYVWGMVAISMLFIIIIWLFSVNDLFKEASSPEDAQKFPDLKENLDQIKSIQDSTPSIKEMIPEGEGIQNNQQSQTNNNPQNNTPDKNQSQENKPILPIE